MAFKRDDRKQAGVCHYTPDCAAPIGTDCLTRYYVTRQHTNVRAETHWVRAYWTRARIRLVNEGRHENKQLLYTSDYRAKFNVLRTPV